MGKFSEGFWNLYIVLATLGGIAWLVVFLRSQSKIGSRDEKDTTGHVWDGDLRELNNPLPAWWKNLFYITLVFGLGYLMLYPGLGSNDMFLGWTQVKAYEEEMAKAEERYGPLFAKYRAEPIEKLARDPEALKIGERLYASYCTQCHGSDAGGVRGFPNLRDDDWLWGGDPETIETTILGGRQAMMPAWEQALGGEQGVRDVAQYVLSLSGRKVDAAAAERGAEKYATVCVACHGPEGKGNPQLGAPNLTDGIWLYGGSPGAVEASIAKGRAGRMPAHREFLGEDKVHLLAAWVYSLSRK